MTKVTWSVPLVQFGRCEVEFDDSDFIGNPEKFGRAYADFVAATMRGYEARVAEIRSGATDLIKSELGATEVGEEPTPEHKHTYVYGDDNNGHSGSFCECGAEEPNENSPSWERKVEKSEPWKTGGPVKKPAKIEWN
jgi:hypothetical protein